MTYREALFSKLTARGFPVDQARRAVAGAVEFGRSAGVPGDWDRAYDPDSVRSRQTLMALFLCLDEDIIKRYTRKGA